MSGILPKFVTPDDVRAYRGRLDPFARAFDRSVAWCQAIDPATRRNWADFYAGWRRFCDTDASWTHASAQYDEAEKYEENLIRWQGWLGRFCQLGVPPLTRPPVSPETSSLEATVKTVAIAGAVIAVAVSLRSVVR